MFVSGVGGTGKSFLIKTIRALSKIWDYKTGSPVCAVTAPTGLAAFNVSGVTIHQLLQLPMEHEDRTAGYWKLGKEALKVMSNSLSQLRLLIIDEVSMVSSLNLAYIHLGLDEIFAKDEWFGGVNVLFVGDILQLPPVNGGVDEIRCGCVSDETIQALKNKVISIPVVDKFEDLLSANKAPLPTRKSCHNFNAKRLSRLDAEIKKRFRAWTKSMRLRARASGARRQKML